MNTLQVEAQELVADGLLGVLDAATFLQIGRAKLYEIMSSGNLPFVLIGRRRLIPRRALVEFAARHLHGGQHVDE